jgi:hypothetical protein
MKRFAWLWGALLGVVLLPLLVIACYYVIARVLPVPPRATIGLFSLSSLLQVLLHIAAHDGVWYGGLGCCGAMLWVGNRSLKWRLLSTLVGTGTMSYVLWNFWGFWRSSTPKNSSYLPFYVATIAPVTFASLLLVFFALLMRSSPTAATKP